MAQTRAPGYYGTRSHNYCAWEHHAGPYLLAPVGCCNCIVTTVTTHGAMVCNQQSPGHRAGTWVPEPEPGFRNPGFGTRTQYPSGHAAVTRCCCREGLYLLFTAGYSALATSKSLSVLEQRYGRACRSTATHIFVVFATI